MVTSPRDFDSYHSQWIKSLYVKYPWKLVLNKIIQLFFPECEGVSHSWWHLGNWYTAEGSFLNTCLAMWMHTGSEFTAWLTKGVAYQKEINFLSNLSLEITGEILKRKWKSTQKLLLERKSLLNWDQIWHVYFTCKMKSTDPHYCSISEFRHGCSHSQIIAVIQM